MRLFLILIIVTIVGCKKTDPGNGLPTPTQNGSDILACLINGKPHIYKGAFDHFFAYGVKFDSTINYGYRIQSENDDNNRNDFYMFVKSSSYLLNTKYLVKGTGDYFYRSSFIDYSSDFNGDEYFADSTTSYVIFTRLDNNVASGSFEFHGIDSKNLTINITSGFFDISRH